jgi:hypothetical protein
MMQIHVHLFLSIKKVISEGRLLIVLFLSSRAFRAVTQVALLVEKGSFFSEAGGRYFFGVFSE